MRAPRRERPAIPAAGGLLACVLGALVLPAGAGATTWTAPGVQRPGASAALVQCVTQGEQAERAATFSGEMSVVAGATRMEMRIDVAERMPEEAAYRTLVAPGLGVWRTAAPGVKTYRYLKQVTNLAGPAYYRGVVRFRWLGAHGRVLALAVLRTRRCEQPAASAPAPAPEAPAANG